MSDSNWITIAGAVTGVIGAVTGVAGAIMGYIAYRHSKQAKTLDLRLEAQRGQNDLRRVIHDLPVHLEHAKKSRCAVAAAIGNYHSGAMKKWLVEWDADRVLAQSMSSTTPSSLENESLSHAELETKIVAIHAALGDAMQLHAKYVATLAQDDKRREELRAHSSRIPPSVDL